MKKPICDIDIQINMSIEEDVKKRTGYATAKIVLDGQEMLIERDVKYIPSYYPPSHKYNRTGAMIDAARQIWLNLFCSVRGQIEWAENDGGLQIERIARHDVASSRKDLYDQGIL